MTFQRRLLVMRDYVCALFGHDWLLALEAANGRAGDVDPDLGRDLELHGCSLSLVIGP